MRLRSVTAIILHLPLRSLSAGRLVSRFGDRLADIRLERELCSRKTIRVGLSRRKPIYVEMLLDWPEAVICYE
jgi:hypothetical protein